MPRDPVLDPKATRVESEAGCCAHSSSDDGVFLNAASPKSLVANMAVKNMAAPLKAPSLASTPVRFDDPSKPLGSDTKFKVG